jgi:pimeloyl-ACP methyl ester carboxylesterase
MIILCALLQVGVVAAIWWAGNELASPGRRPLQDYHREFLADPAAHGVTVQPFTATDGTPCLLMEPLSDGRLGQRGAKIREQLQDLALPPPGQVIGTLVLVHGRKGRKEDYLLIGERLCAAGFRCLLPDMPAHGEHPAEFITFGLKEAGLPASLLADATQRFQLPPQPAGLLGMSMGGAVSMHAAALPNRPWKALVIISSFDRLETAIQKNVSDRVGTLLGSLWRHAAGRSYEWKTGLPLNRILSDLPAAILTLPTLITHGTADRVIPLESGRRLYDALPEGLEKQWIEVPGADHHNVLITDFPIYATIARWMLEHVK